MPIPDVQSVQYDQPSFCLKHPEECKHECSQLGSALQPLLLGKLDTKQPFATLGAQALSQSCSLMIPPGARIQMNPEAV